VYSGRDYKGIPAGDIPVYGTGGYMLSISQALSDKNDAIGIGRKGTIDHPFILKAPFWTVDTLFYCVPQHDYDLDFIYDLYQKVPWKALDESTGVPSLSKMAINHIKVLLPSLPEQKQIGSLFRHVDGLIHLYERKNQPSMIAPYPATHHIQQDRLPDHTNRHAIRVPAPSPILPTRTRTPVLLMALPVHTNDVPDPAPLSQEQ